MKARLFERHYRSLDEARQVTGFNTPAEFISALSDNGVSFRRYGPGYWFYDATANKNPNKPGWKTGR